MQRVGVIGLGAMGSGLAKNLMAAGFATAGFDVSAERMAAFQDAGGRPAPSPREVGEQADAVFVMVMNGGQARSVVLGEDGLVHGLARGGVVILTATIRAAEARALASELEGTGIALVDSPVTGGFAGAQGGTLSMMAAAPGEVLEAVRDPMAAVSRTVHHVGDEAGMGQTVKACLQALIGGIYAATFETAVLAAKAGIPGQVLYDVVSNSGAGSGVANGALENVIDRKFAGTGSHIDTMHKDLTIVVDLARELGVPLFAAANAMQLFQTARMRHPDGDNWVVARILEEMADTEASREGR